MDGPAEFTPRKLLLTKDQAAEVLTISVRQLERLVARDEITPTRIGGLVRFAPRQLELFIERSTTAVAPVAWPTLRQDVTSRRRRSHRAA